jgi:hypothetical protein
VRPAHQCFKGDDLAVAGIHDGLERKTEFEADIPVGFEGKGWFDGPGAILHNFFLIPVGFILLMELSGKCRLQWLRWNHPQFHHNRPSPNAVSYYGGSLLPTY